VTAMKKMRQDLMEHEQRTGNIYYWRKNGRIKSYLGVKKVLNIEKHSQVYIL